MKAVAHGRHAVALNELRSKYRPNLWDRPDDELDPETGRPRFLQVWFPGVHSDAGGGYEEVGLSDVALEWMLGEAEAHGLLLDGARARKLRPDPCGEMHNPLLPFWWILGWRQRSVPPAAYVHASVAARRERDREFDHLCRRLLPDDVRTVGDAASCSPGC